MLTKRKKYLEPSQPGSQKRLRLDEWLSDTGSDAGSFENEGQENSEDEVASHGESQGDEQDREIRPLRPESPKNDAMLVERISFHGKQQKLSKDQNSATGITDPLETSASNIPMDGLNFTQLGVLPALVASLNSMSIRRPTPVQAACIPPLLKGMDCIGNAKTGSGKTVAFAVPILQKLMSDPYGIFALVLTPTRELAFQIAEQFVVLGGPFNVVTAVIVGGMDMIAQAKDLENRPHVVVATPGRLVDHIHSTSGNWDLSRVKFLVLDEADRLLTPTFASELATIFKSLPPDRQTSLFTATISDKIEAIANAPPKPGKSKPFVHRMRDRVETVLTLKQYFILVPSHVREVYLYYLLCNPPSSIVHLRRAPPEKVTSSRYAKKAGSSKKKPPRSTSESNEDGEVVQPPPTIIFCTRPKAVAYLTEFLKALSIRATALHSRLTQRERLTSLNIFRSYVVPVLVSTDVGARGLDIDDVAMVVNWDMPIEPEEYTHRVGRTARRGRGGVAISLVTERDEERVKKVEERIGAELEEMDFPESKVLEPINKVFTAQRVARMQVQDSDFGKREEIHKAKSLKLSGVRES
ncbi:DEAD-domain-containing protein [Serendipita vermifera]|nr:DEAD-domain-containing protein [Serendipita vermifera]